MQDKFKVGDYVIFRKSMHKVADMLNTSFYDVLTSVYEITGTEGRCYLMKSDNGYGRVWKIRKSRIDRLGEKVVFVYEAMQLIGDELKRLGRDLVKKSVVRREITKAKQKANAVKRKELADAYVKDVERMKKNTTATMMTFYRLYKYDGSDWVGFRDESAADDIDINKLEGGER